MSLCHQFLEPCIPNHLTTTKSLIPVREPITDFPPGSMEGSVHNRGSLLWSLQGSTWRGSCAAMPSCQCQSSVRSPAPRTAASAPGRPGPSAHTPARARAPRASRRELAPSSPTTQEKVGANCCREASRSGWKVQFVTFGLIDDFYWSKLNMRLFDWDSKYRKGTPVRGLSQGHCGIVASIWLVQVYHAANRHINIKT